MSERKFKFVSPGVFLKEIDQSQLPALPEAIGPIIIGTAERGPGMRPVSVDSFSEFVQTFGAPYSQQSVSDVWRYGNKAGTTYGAYAAKAWLANGEKATFIRLLGKQNPDQSGGEAGWKSASDAYGLWVFASGTADNITGCLAAIFYSTDTACSMSLSGNMTGYIHGTTNTIATVRNNAVPINPVKAGNAAAAEFKIEITGDKARSSDGSTVNNYVFNFDENSNKFIRQVFNTDPTACGPLMASADKEKYFLGESFENRIQDTALVPNANVVGVMMKMQASGASTPVGNTFQQSSTNSETGWFIGQDLNANTASFDPQNMPKLFKLVSRDSGGWLQNHLKTSVTNIRYGTISGSYGTFDLLIRMLNDDDQVVQTVERFSNCSLDPASPNYIARVVGDKYISYNTLEERNLEIGLYDNKSKYIRIKVDPGVENGTADSDLLPWGALGPMAFKSATYISGAAGTFGSGTSGADGWSGDGPFLRGGVSGVKAPRDANFIVDLTGTNWQYMKFNFPTTDLRVNASNGGIINYKDAYWGAYTGRTLSNASFGKDNLDLVTVRPSGISSVNPVTGLSVAAWNFSLDDVSASFTGAGASRITAATYAAGNRAAGSSITSQQAKGYKKLVDLGLARFTTVFAGGSDGIEIKEKEPFRSALADGKTPQNSYVYETYKRAIDACKDPEEVSFNLATVPSLKTPGLTKRLLEHCENRADALCLMDLENGFLPPAERNSDADPASTTVLGEVETTISALRDRQLNSSYGCAYYPWVQALDDDTNRIVYLPPSVVALGAMSFTDAEQGPWFAPAGFTRGGLSTGISGIPVLNTTLKLTSQNRDDLYETNINPLASFPSEGVVIFGQKTLQVTRSALDRINVRRMLIYVKRRVAQIANNLLFEPNVQDTWDRFLSATNPMLIDVQQRFGIQEYKLVLDSTTTTPDLIDQNIMYAKLFIKPTRAIEFIAVDFFITNTGASFED